MCDIWKANRAGQELTLEQLDPHLDAFRRLRVQQVVLSGGEALMHRNLWALCAGLRTLGVKITLLSTGLLLAKHAEDVVRWCDEVIVSLDGSQTVHDSIRRVPRAFERLTQGVQAVKTVEPSFRVTGRCVIQQMNYQDWPNIIQAAQTIPLDGISFLAADVSSEAFNHAAGWESDQVETVAIPPDHLEAFEGVIEQVIQDYGPAFDSGFIAENPAKLRRMVAYYRALAGQGAFPVPRCNAPSVSAVIETDGTVRPCFFQPATGHLDDGPLDDLLNNPAAVRFRRDLDTATDPICQRCTCSLYLGARADVS